jgi:dihydroneopterin triphosphate diphosphatase
MPKIESNYIELHIFNSDTEKFLLLKRAGHKIYPSTWQMITASCEEGESTKQTAVRELLEETGMKAVKLFAVPHVNTFYFDINDSVCLSPVFLVFVDTEKVKISNEHTEYKWVTYNEAVEWIHWPDQIESLNVIWRYLSSEKLKNKLVELDL